MFKKHKQLITGFILGAIVFGTMPVQAKVQEYLLQKSTAKVMVDGQEFANKELPVLNHKGYNYIPMATFREICDNIGVGFEWAGESGEVQISTGNKIEIQPSAGTEKPISENKNVSIVGIEKDGYKIGVVNGVEYIALREAGEKFHDQGYWFNYIQKTNNVRFSHTDDWRDESKEDILLDDIKLTVFEGSSYMEYSYFKENILTLIQNR